jgi:subtilase family serine protease
MRVRALTAAGAASLLAAGGGVAAASAASATATPARATIAGTRPAWATSTALVRSRGAAPDLLSGTATANVYLAPDNAAHLTSLATAVSTPGNSLYGHYLSNVAAARLFDPTAAEIQQVENAFSLPGISVTKVVPGIGGYVQVSGTNSAIAKAFDVTFGAYKVGAVTYRAPEEAASVPSAIAGDVIAVSGLDTGSHVVKPAAVQLNDGAQPHDVLPPPGSNYFVAPYCSAYYGQLTATTVSGTATAIPTLNGMAQPWVNCGYTPAQIRGAYNVGKSGETGKGVTVAVVDAYASPTMPQDANAYARYVAARGGNPALDKPFRPGQYKQVLMGDTDGWQKTTACTAAGWYSEEALDVESVHGMAPDANVTYVGAASCDDSDLANAIAYIVEHHAADIVTDSWGEPFDQAAIAPTFDTLFQYGAVKGIGFFFSAGDNGYEDPAYQAANSKSDKIQVDYPPSSPWVTAVGGTSLAIGSSNNYEFETAWGTVNDPLTTSSTGSAWTFNPDAPTAADLQTHWGGSGGGGVSTHYQQPTYQKGVVPASLALAVPQGTTKTPMRVVPDVSVLADPATGILYGQTVLGADQKTTGFYLSRIGGTSLASPIFAGIEADAQQASGKAIGFANPKIYALAHANPAIHAFHDVAARPGTFQVRSNYTDPATAALPLVTNLRLLGVNGTGPSALVATQGYDDATGVGSPDNYIQAFRQAGGRSAQPPQPRRRMPSRAR